MRAGVLGTLSLFAVAGTMWAAPEPAIVPRAWEVEFAFHDPQPIDIRLPGDSDATTFWYVLYTVTNTTGREVPFYPSFEIVTDDLTVIEGGANINPAVYDAVEARHRKAYPFFVRPAQMLGPLLVGEDNARTSAMVFHVPDAAVNHFRLYVGGLSGEIEKVRNPRFDRRRGESAGNSQFFTLRKTLAIYYDIPGDSMTRSSSTPVRVRQEWVMR
ncbi:MAG: hypothetical protein HOP29_19545 [Phycisphaerales bacterium]|nr:hypothetical protein [Phycisphaerales bacterium]